LRGIERWLAARRDRGVPIGHRRRREEGLPLLQEKFKTNLRRIFSEERQQQILGVSLDRDSLEQMPVNDYVDLYVP